MIFTHEEEERLAREQCAGLPQGYVIPLAADDPPCEDRQQLAESFLDSFPHLRDKKRVVFLGRLHSKKGIDLLLPAFRQVVAKIPDASLLFVGPAEPDYLTEIKAVVGQLGIEDACHFLGSLAGEQKWSALAAGDVFALPSYQENFAIALVEALRVGTPAVISKRINIWSDLEEKDAVRVAELSVESVADHLMEMLSSDERRLKMGEMAHKYTKEVFSWPVSAQKLRVVYKRVVKLALK